MKPALRLVHTADVHLGELPTPWHGAHPDADERAFARVVDLTIGLRADALLIAGDLFDSNRVPEPAVRFASEQIARLRCPVVLIPGNHDCYDETSIYRRFDFRHIGSHVHTLFAEHGEIVSFDQLGLSVWGKGLIEHAPEYRPMAGAPRRREDAARAGAGGADDDETDIEATTADAAVDIEPALRAALEHHHRAGHWLVGMAHGHFVEDRREPRSSLITPDEIADTGLDYLALGHVHVFRDVSQGAVRACYPGAPRISYAPDAGSVAIIELDPARGVVIEERRLGAVILDDVTDVDMD